jgi:WD40 repeat protein
MISVCVRRHTLTAAVTLVLAGALTPTAAAQDPTKIEIVPTIAHAAAVTSVAFSPDGSRALSSSFDRTVKLWDPSKGQLLRTLEGHNAAVYSAAFSPDGAQVVSASGDKTAKVWVAATGQLLRTLEGHTGFVSSAVYSPDGQRMVSASADKTLRLWDAGTGQLLRTFQGHAGPIYSVAYSPDGTRILSGSEDKTLKLWDVASGQALRTLEGHGAAVYAVAFAPDGTRVVSGSKDKTVKLWNAGTGEVLRNIEAHAGAVMSVAFSADGARLLSGSLDKLLKLWDLATGDLLRTFEGHTRGVRSAVFSPDNTRVLSGTEGTAIRLWAENGQTIRLFERRSAPVLSVAFSPDQKRLVAAGTGGTLDVWNATTGVRLSTLRGHTGSVHSVAFSSDGTRLLSGGNDNTLKLWDAATGKALLTLTGHSNDVLCVAFSPDGTRLVSGSIDKTVRLWDAATGQLVRTMEGSAGAVTAVAFAPDGARVASSSGKNISLWDAATGQLVRTFEGHTGVVSSVAFSSDGARLLSGSWDQTLKLWNPATGEVLHTLTGHTGAVASVAFSRDGARLLSGGLDTTLRLWDAGTGQHLRTFDEHSLRVSSVAFSADGNRLVSGSWDRTVRIWSPSTGQVLATLFSSAGSEWLAMTPAGFYAASERSPDLLSIVRGLETTSVAQVADHLYRPDIVEQLLKGDPLLKYEEAASELHLYKILGSGSAPQIETLPLRPDDRTEDTVRLRARIVDTGGGIGDKIVWRVNGVTQGSLAAPPASRSLTGFRIAEQTFKIDPSKRNNIEVAAYNKAGLLASLPHPPFVVDRYVTTERRPSMHILAIGVSDYADKDWRLQFAVSDARSFVASVEAAAKPIYHTVTKTILLDSQVTKQGIDAAFRALKARVAANDVFVLFVAGHGRNSASTYYFLPQDLKFGPDRGVKTHGIGQDQWQAWLAMIPAQKGILVFDTCESAGAVVLSRGASEREAAMDRLQFATGRSVIAAARNAAMEGYRGHGVLTYAILEALGKGEGSSEHVYVMDVATHVDRWVPEFSQQLTGEPQFPHNRIEGNFPIGVRKAVLKAAMTPVPAKPTHIDTEPLEVFREAGGAGGVVQELIPFTPVALVKSERGWAHIARDGKVLGYVPEDKLRRLAQ